MANMHSGHLGAGGGTGLTVFSPRLFLKAGGPTPACSWSGCRFLRFVFSQGLESF